VNIWFLNKRMVTEEESNKIDENAKEEQQINSIIIGCWGHHWKDITIYNVATSVVDNKNCSFNEQKSIFGCCRKVKRKLKSVLFKNLSYSKYVLSTYSEMPIMSFILYYKKIRCSILNLLSSNDLDQLRIFAHIKHSLP